MMHPHFQWFLNTYPIVAASLVAVSGVIFAQCVLLIIDGRKHRKERERDIESRKFAMKRETYCSYMAALQEMSHWLGRFPNFTAEEVRTWRLSAECEKALAVKDLVSNEPVLKAAQASAKVFRRCLLEISSIKQLDMMAQIDAERHSPLIEKLLNRSDRLVDEGLGLDVSMPEEKRKFDHLEATIKSVHELLDPIIAEQRKAIQKRAAISRQMAEMLPSLILQSRAAYAEAAFAIRADLGFPVAPAALFDAEDEAAASQEMNAIVKEVWDRVNSASFARSTGGEA